MLIARIAAAERWAREPDRAAATAVARSALLEKFAREADPDGTLPPAERTYRAEHLLHAHMLRMGRLAAAGRRRAKAAARSAAKAAP